MNAFIQCIGVQAQQHALEVAVGVVTVPVIAGVWLATSWLWDVTRRLRK